MLLSVAACLESGIWYSEESIPGVGGNVRRRERAVSAFRLGQSGTAKGGPSGQSEERILTCQKSKSSAGSSLSEC